MNNKIKYSIIIIKVAIISISSLYVIDNPYPFYKLSDAMVYSSSGEHLANGMYGFSNEPMQRYHGGQFIPMQWVGTVHDTAIPITQVGMPLVSAMAFLMGGQMGLFFVGPLSAILLFVASERISTKLFGPIPGLVTLVIVVTNDMILWNGRGLHSDLIFALLIALGFFYFVKFFQENKNKQILLASTFFALSAVFRIPGVVIFPIELISFFAIFIYGIYFTKILKPLEENEPTNNNFQTNNFVNNKNIFLKTKILSKQNQKIIKWSFLMVIPWLIFFAFFMLFNYYYFDDPFTTYRDELRSQQLVSSDLKGNLGPAGETGATDPQFSIEKTSDVSNSISSNFIFDKDSLDWINYFSIGLIPDNLTLYLRDGLQTRDIHFIDNNWISIIIYSVFASSILIAFFKKFMRIEVFLILILILGFLVFHAGISSTPYENASEISKDVQFRYMIPSYVLFAMLGGLITSWVIKSNNFKTISIKGTNLDFLKIGFFIILFAFLISAIYESDAIKYYSNLPSQFFEYPDADAFLKSTRGEIPDKAIIITQNGRWAVNLWDGIPFKTSTGWDEGKWDKNKIKSEDIQIIKTLMNENYEFFSTKSQSKQEVFFFRHIELEHDLILKNYSTNLCKLEKSSDNITKQISDDVCYGTGRNFVEKFQ